MKKRLLSLLIVLCIAISLFPAATAAEIIASGTCGENLTWVLTEDGTLTISGEGDMDSYTDPKNEWEPNPVSPPWQSYRSSITRIVIGDDVTWISGYAFNSLKNLTDVVIGKSLTGIGGFAYCTSLTQINIPENIRYINSNAFEGCTALRSIIIPDTVTHINAYAFMDCTNLTSVIIGNSVEEIEKYAFQGCPNLSELEIGTNVTFIGMAAFEGCSSLSKVIIPDSVETLGSDCFSYCSSLADVKLGSGFTKIGSYTFYECASLEEIIIPSNISDIRSCAFWGCTSLNTIWFEGSAPTFSDYVFGDCGTITAYHPYDASWTENVKTDHDAEQIIWIAYCPANSHIPSVAILENSIPATCTSCGGYDTVYYCENCNAEINRVTTFVPAMGHDYANGICTRCGETNPDYVKPVENPFIDVPVGAFYETPVLWALDNNITTGATADSFNPDGKCLRAQVVTFLHRAKENPEPNTPNNPFSDVKSSDFFYKPVLWAVENSITNGTSATTFGSYDVCNRAAVVTFLWRAAGSPEPESTDNPFTDVKPGDFFYKPVLWAIENGVTNGVDATHFGPTTPCNRAQVVTFLYRAYN